MKKKKRMRVRSTCWCSAWERKRKMINVLFKFDDSKSAALWVVVVVFQKKTPCRHTWKLRVRVVRRIATNPAHDSLHPCLAFSAPLVRSPGSSPTSMPRRLDSFTPPSPSPPRRRAVTIPAPANSTALLAALRPYGTL